MKGISSLKHALITGGSSGIGKALAFELANQAYRLTLIARDSTKLQSTIDDIKRCHPSAEIQYFNADVGIKEEISKAIEQAIVSFGPPDILVTSAGISMPGYFETMNIDNFEKTIQTNYMGAVYTIKAALDSMLTAKRGSIVLISSGAGLTGIFGYSSYSPSKFAISGLGEVLRAELKSKGIHVAVVYPPDTNTPQLVFEETMKPKETKKITSNAKIIEPQVVAKKIVRGIKKRRFTITPGFEMTMLARYGRLLLPILHYCFDKQASRAVDKQG